MKEIGSIVGIEAVDVYDLLTTLCNQGFLLKKGPKLYQLLSVEP